MELQTITPNSEYQLLRLKPSQEPLSPMGYLRVSTEDQNEDRQMPIIQERHSYLSLDDDFIFHTMEAEEHPRDRMLEFNSKSAIIPEHSDRILKTDQIKIVEELHQTLLEIESKVVLEDKELELAKKLFEHPTLELFAQAIRERFIETTPNIISRRLNYQEWEIVQECYKEFLKSEQTNWGDLSLWRIFAFLGYTVNRILRRHREAGQKIVDNSFGNAAQEVRLFRVMQKYKAKGIPQKEWGRKLGNNHSLYNENGKQFSEASISQYMNKPGTKTMLQIKAEAERALVTSEKELPAPFDTFMFPTSPTMLRAAKALGFSSLKEEQVQTLSALREGRNVVLSTRTGGGKSQLPPLCGQMKPEILILVIIPTLKLNEHLQKKWEQHFPEGSVRRFDSKGDPKSKTLRELKAGTVRLLLTTPNSLRDSTELRVALKERGVGLLVIDEAHNTVHAAKTYRPEYALIEIQEAWEDLGNPQFLMTTATLDRLTEHLIRLYLNPITLIRGSLERPNLMLHHCKLPNRGAKILAAYELLRLIKMKRKRAKTILFFSTVNDLMSAKETLEKLGLSVHVYFSKAHEKVREREKREHLEAFANDPKGILLTTCTFGEGIDIPDVVQVICFALPSSLVELAQWAGRAGRNNKPAHIWLFSDPHGKRLREFMIDSAETKSQRLFAKQRWRELLNFLEANPKPTLDDVNYALQLVQLGAKLKTVKRTCA